MTPRLSHCQDFPVDYDPNDVVQAYATNSAFRSAERHELSTEHDPLRRPVRPDDLSWLDFSCPMSATDATKLTALLGNRMLRNVYDAELLYLPIKSDSDALSNFSSIYSADNRLLSAWVKPILEKHLFTLLDEEIEMDVPAGYSGLTTHILESYEKKSADAGVAVRAARSAVDSVEAATFVLLQYSAIAPACYTAIARGALGEYQDAHPALRSALFDTYREWINSTDAYRKLLTQAGLSSCTGAYWQLYLGSSLGRANYLHHLASNHEQVCQFIGAYLHWIINEWATRDHYHELFSEGFNASPEYFQPTPKTDIGSLSGLIDSLIAPLVNIFGPTAIGDIKRGFAAANWLELLWSRDLEEQVAWADQLDEYKDKADKIANYIYSEDISVDLDTFVESCDETSTTHVHDDHRLVMIEQGTMHFWNNITHRIRLTTGDRILIPATRLHGSTVLSGQCTYHQPIITNDLLQKACGNG